MKEYVFEIDGESYRVKILEAGPDGALVEVNGRKYRVSIPAPTSTVKPPLPAPAPPATTSAAEPEAAPAAGGGIVQAPMPGVILKVLVEPGDAVAVNDPVLVLEAMKMENEIKAPVAGTVEKIFVSEGGSVNTGDDLFRIQP